MSIKNALLPILVGTLLSSPAFAACPEYEPVALSEGTPVQNLAGAAGDLLYFVIDSPPPGSELFVSTSGGIGDIDLFVSKGSLPLRGNADNKSIGFENDEWILIGNSGPGKHYILVYGFADFSGLTLTAWYTDPVNQVPLEAGVARNNLARTAGQSLYFTFESLGNTTIRVETSGGTGDLDLFVRKDGIASTYNYDYSSEGADNNEEVFLRLPEVGTYHVTLYAFEDFAGVTINTFYQQLTPVPQVFDGTVINNLSANADEQLLYVVESPGDGRSIRIATTGLGDLDLFVKEGPLSSNSLDYFSEGPSSDEELIIPSPQPGIPYYIFLYAFSEFSNVSLSADFVSPQPVTSLSNGVPVNNLSGMAAESAYFRIEVPPGQCDLRVTSSGGVGDADLYVRRGTFPTASLFAEYSDAELTNAEQVIIPNPDPGTYYIELLAYEAYTGVNLTASTTPDPDAGLWNDAAELEGGWNRLPWFGYFVQFQGDWIYHLEHGFQFYSGYSPASFFFYDTRIESWFWTSEDAYPGLYKLGPGAGWYWYFTGAQKGYRTFMRLSDGSLLTEGQL